MESAVAQKVAAGCIIALCINTHGDWVKQGGPSAVLVSHPDGSVPSRVGGSGLAPLEVCRC